MEEQLEAKARAVLDKIDDIVGEAEGVSLDLGYLKRAGYSLDEATQAITALIQEAVNEGGVAERRAVEKEYAKSHPSVVHPFMLTNLKRIQKLTNQLSGGSNNE